MPFLQCCLATLASYVVASSAPQTEPYRWKNVAMSGAGFVDGIVFHPTAKGVCYCRTDMGGAYRWSPKAQRWEPLLDWLSYEDLNLMGVESIALDPHDPKRVYMACGTYTLPQVGTGAILRSQDYGKTWQRTNVPIKFGGNENGRGNGERMSVDPTNGAHLVLGTRKAGLWESRDYGATWKPVSSFPLNDASIVVTAFTPKGSIYAAVSKPNTENILRSTDGGATWVAVKGQQTAWVPTHMVLAKDGMMYVSYGSSGGPSPMLNGAVWRLDTQTDVWTDVTPEKPDTTQNRRFGYAAVAMEQDKPNVIIASTHNHPDGEQIFRSTDSGKTWKPIIGDRTTYDFSKAPYTSRVGIHWLFDIEIDPANPDHALFTTGYGGHETFNLTDADCGKPVRWSAFSTGIEESVALELCSPNKGAQLLTAIGDYGGFVHHDLDKPSPEGNFINPHFGNTDSIQAAELAPNVIVRVGRASGYDLRVNIGYSLDFGKTWQPAKPPTPNASSGHIALSPNGKTWIWSVRGHAYRTTDYGKTWTECVGLASGVRVENDRVNSSRFYGIDLYTGLLYSSIDGGTTFTTSPLHLAGGTARRGSERGDSRGGQDHLYVTPGKESDLWIAAYDGLHHSVNAGKSFERMAGVTELHGFGFGAGYPSTPKAPALYLVGIVRGVRGIFRSNDLGENWTRINDDQHQWGLVLQVTGDPKKYGRVYVGTHGRGVFYGEPR